MRVHVHTKYLRKSQFDQAVRSWHSNRNILRDISTIYGKMKIASTAIEAATTPFLHPQSEEALRTNWKSNEKLLRVSDSNFPIGIIMVKLIAKGKSWVDWELQTS